MPSPNPNLKVKDEDNIFLKSMELKVVPLSYRSRCLICKEEFDASNLLNAKRACLVHIIQRHKDVWIDHRRELMEG
jgi:hypothetical protein